MLTYLPQQFIHVYKTPIGHRIWQFLNSPDNLIRMETASVLYRPAIEPLSPLLLKKFGDKVKDDRIKQMVGHMVRQIMENHGFTLDAQNVTVRTGNLFARGSRYIKSDFE